MTAAYTNGVSVERWTSVQRRRWRRLVMNVHALIFYEHYDTF